jgi:hypothetical protein
MPSVSAKTILNEEFFDAATLDGGFGLGLPGTSREGVAGGRGVGRSAVLTEEIDPFWYQFVRTNGLASRFVINFSLKSSGTLKLG